MKQKILFVSCAFAFSACVGPRVLPPSPDAPMAAGDFHARDLTKLPSFRLLSPNPIAVAVDGKVWPIVASDEPRAVSAAFVLADVLRRSTGVRPEVFRVSAGQDIPQEPAFFVGDGVAAQGGVLPRQDHPDAFRVVASADGIRFLGRPDYAVCDWCERQLGVRCYGPEDEDFVVPAARAFSVLSVDYSDRPVFAHRDFGSYSRARWGIFAKTGRPACGFVRVHVPAKWHQDPDVATVHSNIFARARDGGRARTPMLCYGNPQTLEYYCRRIDEHIAGIRDSGGIVDSATKTISVSPWDAFVDCTCDRCRTLMDPSAGIDGYASRAVWGYFLPRLARWAAKSHSGYRIAFLPYWNACTPPEGLNLRKYGNTDAVVCVMPGLALLKNKATRIREEERIREWRCVTGSLPTLWHYSCWPAEYTCAPYIYGETIRRHFRSLRGEIDGAFVCAGGDMPRHQLSLYVWMRCLWNPEIDVSAVYDGYARSLFGAAAVPVREMIRIREKGWSKDWPDERLTDANVFGISYPPGEVRKLRSLLEEARRLAADDPAVSARLGCLEADWAEFFRRAEAYARGVRRPLVNIPFAALPPVIDGRLDDDCWRAADARRFVTAFGAGEPWAGTEARTVWTSNEVVFAFRCIEPAMAHVRRDAAQGDFLKQDVISVLFDVAGTDAGQCLHLMLDVNNRLSAFAGAIPWEPDGVRCAVHMDETFWSAEISVPFSAVKKGGIPHPGAVWSVNMVRNRLGDAWRKREERLPGSRSELTRLSTCGSSLNTDRDAFLPFCFTR